MARALIVLGAAVWPGGVPSPALARRVDAAAAAWRPGDVVIATGGLGRHPPAEAAVAAMRLTAAGLPAEAIAVEGRSTATVENVVNALALIPQAACPVLVSDAYHLPRARLIARVLGRPMAGLAAAPEPGRSPLKHAGRILREAAAVPWSAIRAVRARRRV